MDAMDANLLKLAARNGALEITDEMRSIAVAVHTNVESKPMEPKTDEGIFLPDEQGRPLMDLGYIIVRGSYWIEGVDSDDGGMSA